MALESAEFYRNFLLYVDETLYSFLQPLTDSDLKCNRVLDEIVLNFKLVRYVKIVFISLRPGTTFIDDSMIFSHCKPRKSWNHVELL